MSTTSSASASFSPCNRIHSGAALVRCKLPFGCRAQASAAVLPCIKQENLSSERQGKARLAVFVSGGGSNFREIHTATISQRIAAEVTVVVSDKPTCGACRYAAEAGLPIVAFPADHERAECNPEHNLESPEALTNVLKDLYKVDYALLAGYLKLVPKEVVSAFPRAMLNIHPGLLPAFGGKGYYGNRVHKAVLASGARFTGPTVHFVDENFDTGPILAQRVIPVCPLEDHMQLAHRVLQEEHILYPQAVAALVERRITWRDDGIPIIWTAK